MKRVLCAWLPSWPLDRLRRAERRRRDPGARRDETLPFALVETVANALLVAAANGAAREGGVFAGQALTHARAVLPGLATAPIDRAADARALKALALWARRFSPATAVDGCDGIALDVAGCARLFEGLAQDPSPQGEGGGLAPWPDFAGERALMDKLAERLAAAGIEARLGLADTHAAAWGIARYDRSGDPSARLVAPGECKAALARLPPAALGLDEETARLLARLGFATIGEVAAAPRIALERRFRSRDRARAALAALDRAFGRADEPFSPLAPPPSRLVRIAPPEPLLTFEAIRIGLSELAERLLAGLDVEGRGARRVALHIQRADGTGVRLEVATARPCREPDHLMRLFDERLSEIDPGFGVDQLVLKALATEAIAPAPTRLALRSAGAADGAPPLRPHDRGSKAGDAGKTACETEEAAARLVDRLAARLGAGAVYRLGPRDSWSPERAQTRLAFDAARPDWSAETQHVPPRPVRLLDPPEPVSAIAELPDGPPARFIWRRVPRRVAKAQGPERITPEWWRGLGAKPERPRDYYAVEDEDGRRYWLFREGLYEGGDPADPPVWRMHGLFA